MGIQDRLGGYSSRTAVKAPCRLATTANVVLSGFQTIDSVTPTSSDDNLRILVKTQTDAKQNGIYIMAAGAWQRAVDFNGNNDFVKGTIVTVNEGSTNLLTSWRVSTSDPIVIGTSNITFLASPYVRTSYSIFEFNAVGDGVTDDAVPLQAAADSAQWVYFPPGFIFATSTEIVIKDGTKFVGAGGNWKRRTGYAVSEGTHSEIKYIGAGGNNTCVVRVSAKAVGTQATDLTAPGTDDLVNITLLDLHVNANNLAEFGWYIYRAGNNASLDGLTAEKATGYNIVMLGIFAAVWGHFGAYESEEHGVSVGEDLFGWSVEHNCYALVASFHTCNNGTDQTYVSGSGTDLHNSGGFFRVGRGSVITIFSEGNFGRAAILASDVGAGDHRGPIEFVLPYIEGNGDGAAVDYRSSARAITIRDGYIHPGNGSTLLPQDFKVIAAGDSGTVVPGGGPSDPGDWLTFRNFHGQISGTAFAIDSNTTRYYVEHCDPRITYPDQFPSGMVLQDGTIALTMGADSGARTRTNSTDKTARLAFPHYFNTEEPVGGLFANISATGNNLAIGGGTASVNAATNILFYTATNTQTVTGTLRAQIATEGIRFQSGHGISTGQTIGNTALLQAYDVDGATYVTFGTLTAGNTPTFDLGSSTTIGGLGVVALATPYVIGDIPYANSTSTLAKLAAVASGSVLVSAGTGTAPAWSSAPTLTTSLTTPLHIGGTGVGSTTTIKSTTGVGTTDAIIFQVGNNGGTEAGRFNTAGQLEANASTSVAAPPITFSGDLNTGIGHPAADTLSFSVAGTEAARFLSTGTLLIGHTASINIGVASAANLQMHRAAAAGFSCSRWTNDTGAPIISIGKSRGTAISSNAIVQDGDDLGFIFFAGDDGTDLVSQGASIRAQVDGTPGVDDMPGRLLFSTTADGAATVTERMRITAVGNVKIAGSAVRATTEGTNHLDIFNGTAPVGTLANGISLYSTAGELRVMDSAGNATLLSPHDSVTNEWIFDSVETTTGRHLKIRVEAMLKALNKRFGYDFIREFTV